MQAINALQVTAGLFTVALNAGGEFGANAFSGNARWLQIAVRSPAGGGGFTTLAPRQPLTAAPHALFALNAATATNATSATMAASATNATQLNGQPAAFYQNASSINSGTLADARLSGNVALLNNAQTFTARPTFSAGITTNGFTLPSSPQAGYVLSSDASGVGTWQADSLTLPFSASASATVAVVKVTHSGMGHGLWGQTAAYEAAGVLGVGTAVSGSNYGGYFQSTSTSGRGVYSQAVATSGTTYGVHGTSYSADGFGVYSQGNMGSSGVKPFRIDHPDDPANKYLLHYATESPEVINFYRGTVTLDGTGEAVVELPHYFAKINKTPSYQLTAVGAPMPMLHVAEEIDEAALSAGATAGAGVAAPACTFRIAAGAPGAKVSWEVKAVRNDLWVQNRAMPVEVAKQGLEKGTYQHPEFYGLSAEMGMNYAAPTEGDLHDRPDTERPASRSLPDAPPE